MRGITPDYVLWESRNGRMYSSEQVVVERQLIDAISLAKVKWDEMARRLEPEKTLRQECEELHRHFHRATIHRNMK